MKKLLLVFTVLLSVSACDSLSPDIQNNDLIDPDHEYEIDTWGSNSEVYEFTPRSDNSKSCVVFILDNLKSATMQCFKKD